MFWITSLLVAVAAPAATPEVPEGPWYRRFSGMTVCGEGDLVKTFLTPGQSPKGTRVR